MSGKSEQAKGHVEEAAGIVTGDEELEAQGKSDRVAGEVEEKFDKAKDKAHEGLDKVEDAIDSAIDKGKDALHKK